MSSFVGQDQARLESPLPGSPGLFDDQLRRRKSEACPSPLHHGVIVDWQVDRPNAGETCGESAVVFKDPSSNQPLKLLLPPALASADYSLINRGDAFIAKAAEAR
jgi:hypothetical protein